MDRLSDIYVNKISVPKGLYSLFVEKGYEDIKREV